MVLKLFTTFIVVAAILASPEHRDFTWSYRSSIYRVHCLEVITCVSLIVSILCYFTDITHNVVLNLIAVKLMHNSCKVLYYESTTCCVSHG